MRFVSLFLAALALSLSAPAAASADDLEVVRVRKADGSVVPGFILEKRDDGILVRGADGDVFIPFSEIEEVEQVSSPIESAPAPEAAPPPPPSSRAPQPHLVDPADVFLSHPGWNAYERTRIVLVDKRGRMIGPAYLGFSSRDFGRDDDEDYYALRGGRHLSLPEFVEISGSDDLADKFDHQLEKARIKTDFGWGFLALSGSLGVFGWPLAIGGASTGDLEASFIGPGLIGWSVGTLVIAGILHKSGYGRLKELRGTQFEEFVDRRDLWPHVQEHNGVARRAAGLPDDEEADAQ